MELYAVAVTCYRLLLRLFNWRAFRSRAWSPFINWPPDSPVRIAALTSQVCLEQPNWTGFSSSEMGHPRAIGQFFRVTGALETSQSRPAGQFDALSPEADI